MNPKRMILWGLCVVAAVALSACGRTEMPGTGTDAGGDGSGDGPLPCTPSCTKICALQKSCGIISAGDVAACEAQCNADPTSVEMLCLGQLVCKSAVDCSAAKQCMSNPQAPDLTVSHYASSPATGQIGYQATVCNNGSGAASTFRVHFYRNRTSPPTAGEMGDRNMQISGLAAGKCQTVTVTDTGLAAGTYNTYTYVDADRAVLELNESNNVHGPQKVTIGGTTKQPDLVVQNLTAVPTSYGPTTYYMTVCN